MAFSFELFALALSGRVCVTTARIDILRQVVVAGKQVGGEIEEIAGQNVWVLSSQEAIAESNWGQRRMEIWKVWILEMLAQG